MSLKNPSGDEQPLAADIIWGGAAIAKEIGRTTANTLYHLERGNLPGKKIGNIWTSSRRRLRELLCAGA